MKRLFLALALSLPLLQGCSALSSASGEELPSPLEVAELVATGTPAILVPSPNVAEDHQTENALALADAGCAAVLPEREMASREFQDGEDGTARPEGASTLARLVSDLLRDPERMRAMAAAAAAADTPRAAEEIAKDVARVARR